MQDTEYQKMYQLEQKYWWFVGRHQLIDAVLKSQKFGRAQSILDVGCGTGQSVLNLTKFGPVMGVDSSTKALNFCKTNNINAIKGDAINLPLSDEKLDVVTAFDLLEHVEKDELALKEFFRVCKPGGALLITVPAYKILWSDHDRALHHKRRYTASEISKKIERAGFKIEKVSYLLFFLFIPILIFRLLQRLQKKSSYSTSLILLPDFLNTLLIEILALETFLIKKVNLPIGVSIIVVAKKP